MQTTPGNEGHCVCCRSKTFFRIDGPHPRSHYRCNNCESAPRFRHIIHVLDRLDPQWTRRTIHESSPGLSFIQKQSSAYSFSHLIPGQTPGHTEKGIRCEDLEHLTFADDSFDIFITQDVMEHIFDPGAAFREIMRVLKPGGIHVFTAPRFDRLPKTRCRARRQGNDIEYLMPAEYHGNPVGDHRSLVVWDYGIDFECLIGLWTRCPVTTYLTRDLSLGLDGQFLDVFVVRKPALET